MYYLAIVYSHIDIRSEGQIDPPPRKKLSSEVPVLLELIRLITSSNVITASFSDILGS